MSSDVAARAELERERVRTLAPGTVHDEELVREFFTAVQRRVGWSNRIKDQVVAKVKAVGLNKMELVRLAFTSTAESLGAAFDEEHGIDRKAEAAAAAAAEAEAEAEATAANAKAETNAETEAEAKAGADESQDSAKADAGTHSPAPAAAGPSDAANGGGADPTAATASDAAASENNGGDSTAAAQSGANDESKAAADGTGAGRKAPKGKLPPVSPVKRVRIAGSPGLDKPPLPSTPRGADGVKPAASTADAAAAATAGGGGDDSQSVASAAVGAPQPLLVNRLMRRQNFRPFAARTVAIAVGLMQDKEGQYYFVAPVLNSPVTNRPVKKPKVRVYWFVHSRVHAWVTCHGCACACHACSQPNRGLSSKLSRSLTARELNMPVAVRALTRSMSHMHADPNANVGLGAPPPEPIIRPETAVRLACSTVGSWEHQGRTVTVAARVLCRAEDRHFGPARGVP